MFKTSLHENALRRKKKGDEDRRGREGKALVQVFFLPLPPRRRKRSRTVLELVGSQTWIWLLLLRQGGGHGDGGGVGHAGEGGGSSGEARCALPFPGGRALGLEDVGGVLEEGPAVREVLVLQDLWFSR